jgi:hypothetical protein
MSMVGKNELEQDDYSVVVKSHARVIGRWRWEIYRAGRKTPISRSAYDFSTIGKANREGRDALSVLLKQLKLA